VDLCGRVAVVTGGSQGIGAGIARALSTAGADVAVSYLTNRDAALAVVDELRERGRASEAFQADVADRTACEELVSSVRASLGGVDILMNNAGARNGDTGRALLTDVDPEWVRRIFDEHVMGSFLLSRAVISAMRAKGRGNIIMISSVATAKTAARVGPYTIAKRGMEVLAQTLAKEERDHGIRVNILAPGAINTRGTPEEDAVQEGRGVSAPPLDVSDIGAAVVFLCSDSARNITGQRLAIDGGH
jgi:NAD(P)-dependent dehydrogenase (short-subunit alcohol dehydrogenase family)